MIKFNRRAVGLALAALIGAHADAQALRDPTVPPPEAGPAGNVVAAGASKLQPGNMAIIVREGKPYVVVGTRLYAQGQMLGQARIERITETEVWLREGRVLSKLSQFSGVERRTVK